MANRQKSGNREMKKPKATKPKATPQAASFSANVAAAAKITGGKKGR